MQRPLSGDASPTQPSAGLLQPTASVQFVSCYFCGAAIVFPKTASLQPAIDPELFMDVFMDSVLAFSTTLR